MVARRKSKKTDRAVVQKASRRVARPNEAAKLGARRLTTPERKMLLAMTTALTGKPG
jgi:hypothetical protein